MTMTKSVLACVSAILLAGCANMSVRRSQDWSQVDDPRLFKTVQVGNWGSGVIVEHSRDRMLVLTCAHLVEDGESVDVFRVNSDTRRYEKRKARVMYRGHPHKDDLALLTVHDPPPPRLPFVLALAGDFEEGEERAAAIMNVSCGADKRPFAWEGRIFQCTVDVSSVIPDRNGRTRWQLPTGILHGGVTQANSGSPVFEGERLVGLNESSPGIGNKGNTYYTGVQTSLPQTVRSFMVEARKTLEMDVKAFDTCFGPVVPPELRTLNPSLGSREASR